MTRNGFNVPGAASVGSYSHAVEIDGFLYLAGQTALDPPTEAPAESGVGEQTRGAMANLIAVLETAGLTLDHVVKCNAFLADMADFDEYDAVYRSFFAQPYPARTTVQVAGLPMGARVEIEMVAHRSVGRT